MLITANQITVGTQLAERDGYLWDVTEIVKTTAQTITIRLNSDFSSFKKHWKGDVGEVKTFRKTSRLQAVLPMDQLIDGIMQEVLKNGEIKAYSMTVNQLDYVLSVAITKGTTRDAALNWLTYQNIPDYTRGWIKKVFNID